MTKPLLVIQGGVEIKPKSEKWKSLLEQARKALAKAVEIRVDTSCVKPMPGQPRVYFNQESILRLAESIRAVGQVYPGIVRKIGTNTYELLDGERRWRAVTLVGIPYRALLVDINSEAVPFLIAAIANFNREAHTAIEISDSIETMYEKIDMPMEEIAKVLGITVPWAYQMLSLRLLHGEVRDMLDPSLPKEKRLPVTAAIQLARMPLKLQPQLARRVLEKDVTLNGLRKEVIRVSNKEGIVLREKNTDPSQKWRVIGRRMGHLRRYVGDLEDALNQRDLSRMVKTRAEGFGIDEAFKTIEDVRRILDRAEKMLLKAKVGG